MKKIWKWIKPVLLKMGAIIGGILLLIFTVRKIGFYIEGLIGDVKHPDKFRTVPGVKDRIYVFDKDHGEWVDVRLPLKVKAKNVKAVQIIRGQHAKIEVLHEAKDRRNRNPVDDSAHGIIGSGG